MSNAVKSKTFESKYSSFIEDLKEATETATKLSSITKLMLRYSFEHSLEEYE